MAARFRFLYALIFLFFLSCAENRMVQREPELVPRTEVLTSAEQDILARYFVREKTAHLDELIDRYNRYYGFHGNVLVASKGNIIYEKATGYADLREKTPLTTDADFQLASVSKQFTAMSVCILHEEGKLDYDDAITDYFPQLPYKKVTLRHLLNHTSGLPNYMWLVESSWRSKEPPYNDQVIDLMAKKPMGVYFSPGRRFDYSNTGYMLLAAVVEKASGENFQDFVEERIFKPLEMNSSFVYSSAKDKSYPCRLEGFTRARWGYRPIKEDIHNGTVGDKGVYSTVEDLYKWDQALYTEKLVRASTLEEAFTPGKLNSRRSIPYGFGFRISEREDKKVVYHNGLWHGFRTSIMRYIEDSATIIVLSHTDCERKNLLVHQIEDVLFHHEEFNPVKVISGIAIQQGIRAAMEQYQRMATQGNLANLRPEQLAEVAQLLRGMNKPLLADRLLQLQQELNHFASLNPDTATHIKG